MCVGELGGPSSLILKGGVKRGTLCPDALIDEGCLESIQPCDMNNKAFMAGFPDSPRTPEGVTNTCAALRVQV